MKSGKSLVELAQELTRIQETARDFVVPTESLEAKAVDGGLVLSFETDRSNEFNLNNWSGGQLASYTDIPKAYFDRLSNENPALAASNINHGLEKQAQAAKAQGRREARLVRTLDNGVRGLLSSRYRILDAHDMLESVLPVMQKNEMQVTDGEITDRRLYIKALAPRVQAEVSKGDVVQYGLTISTSDVGAGSIRVEPLIFRLVCQNGLIMPSAIRKYHVGRNQAEDDIRELLSDKTREMSDTAFWMQVRDVVEASMKPEFFQREVDKLRLAANQKIENFDLPRVVELAMKSTGITGENKKNSILSALASGNEGAGLTQWGLINSFTRAAYDEANSYEESIELERAAGLILELPKTDWALISARPA